LAFVPQSWHPGSLPRLEAVELPPKPVFCISAVDELAWVRCLPERRKLDIPAAQRRAQGEEGGGVEEQGRVPMKLWTDGVEVEREAMQ
jgi:hypothetical protein